MLDRASKVLRGRALSDPSYSLVALVADMEAQISMLEAMLASEGNVKNRKMLRGRIKDAAATIEWALAHPYYGDVRRRNAQV